MPVSTRTATLSESPNAPTFTVGFTGQRWNGDPIVVTTVDHITAHLAALAASDPNGTWADMGVYVDDDDRVMWHNCDAAGCDMPDHDYADDVAIGETASANVLVYGLALYFHAEQKD